MKKLFLSTILLFLIPANSYAAVVGGSNLGFSGYPSNKCAKPTKPVKPDSFDNQDQVDSYNSQIELYNSQHQEYINCINEYIANANNDVKKIKERAQEAVDEANN
ncbi:MAG: hypothetical protein WCA63_10455 [Gallionella sp.]